LQICEAECEGIRESVQFVGVREVILLDPAVVAATGHAERLSDLLVGHLTIH
jgi:hypothetical protein